MTRIRKFVVGGALLMVAALYPGDRAGAADNPRSLAAVLPAQAVAVIETDDLAAMLKRWRDSKLHKAYARSTAARELEKSRLYLRLEKNLGELEEVSGISLTLDRLVQLSGHRSALGLYNVPNTSFVLVTELTSDEARASNWFGQKGKMEPREHRGVKYLLKEGGRNKASLAVALVGQRLIAGTDLESFRGALVLAARAAGQTVSAPSSGQSEPSPLAALPEYQSVARLAPSTPVSVWVSSAGLTGHYFDDYWIFGAETARGLRAAWIALVPGDETTGETRVYLYRDGERPQVAARDGGDVGKSDVLAATAALPADVPFASAFPVDGAAAARALAEMLPRPSLDARLEASALDAIAAALGPAEVRRALEVLEPGRPKGGLPEHHGAIALGCGAPTKLDGAALEKALSGALAPGLSAGAPLPFADDGDLRVLRLPLVPEWALSWKRAGDAVVVGTDPAATRKLATALGRAETAKLLSAGAARTSRLDVERASAFWRDTTRTLALRENWTDPSHANLFNKSIGGLFTVVKDTRQVVTLGYNRGPSHYVEEVQYRGK